MREIASLPLPEEAAHWARTALEAKSRLTASDARSVELAFELCLSALAEKQTAETDQEGGSATAVAEPVDGRRTAAGRRGSAAQDIAAFAVETLASG